MVDSASGNASPQRVVQADGSIFIAGAKLRFRVAVLKPGYVLMTSKGARSEKLEDIQAERMMLHELEVELRRAGALTVFADLREASRMPAESREVVTAWMQANRQQLKCSHVLVSSKLLEMAMSIIGMLVGGGLLKVYSQPKAFLEAVRAAAPDLLALPAIDQPSTGS